MIFAVRKRLRRADDYRISGMYPDGIDIFHVAYGYGGVVAVAYYLVFDFFIALYALFHKYLRYRRKREGVFKFLAALFGGICKSAARSAERERGTQYHRISDSFGCRKTFFDRVCRFGRKHRLAQRIAKLFELFAVLCLLYACAAGAEQLGAAFAQYSFFVKLHGEVKAYLSSDSRNDGVRPLVTDNLCNVFERERLHVNLVGNGGVGHYRRRVGVAQNNLIALLLQCETGLGSGIVEFRSLTDNYRTGPDNEYLFYVGALRHSPLPPSFSERICRTGTRCPAVPEHFPGGTVR